MRDIRNIVQQTYAAAQQQSNGSGGDGGGVVAVVAATNSNWINKPSKAQDIWGQHIKHTYTVHTHSQPYAAIYHVFFPFPSLTLLSLSLSSCSLFPYFYFPFSLRSIATFMENCYTITFPRCHCDLLPFTEMGRIWRVFQEQKKRHRAHTHAHIEWHNHFRFRWQTVIDQRWLLNWPEHKHTHAIRSIEISF